MSLGRIRSRLEHDIKTDLMKYNVRVLTKIDSAVSDWSK